LRGFAKMGSCGGGGSPRKPYEGGRKKSAPLSRGQGGASGLGREGQSASLIPS
jgi:hypothetical protein